MSNLQTYYHFKLDLKKCTNIQEASGYSTASNATGQSVLKPGTPLYNNILVGNVSMI